MGVFTTSWWVVNQPIVDDIFTYAFPCFRLFILLLLELKPLSLHIDAYLVSYHWWGETLWFMSIYALVALLFAGRCSRA